MELKDFEHVRVGSGFPACVDVKRIGAHESYGVMAVAYTYQIGDDENYVQVRRSKDNRIAVLSLKFKMGLPEGWEDSEILWDSRKQ